jgi:sterol desaturase/sphingolipid hydroxylase (fatty acid hydroxylase superfamily)
MLIGFNGLGIWAILSGISYWWLLPIGLAAMATSFAAERIAPYQEAWNLDHGDTERDVAHAIVYEICNFNSIVLLPFLTWMVPWQLWPTDWPILAQLAFAIVVGDIGMTLIHYLSHKWPLLWRFHEIHHGSPRLYGLNGLVRHPLHQTLDLAIGFMPLILLGMPQQIAVMLGFCVTIQLMIQHSNADYRVGVLQHVLSIGNVHRLHHVRWDGEGDVNFALFFTVWDRLLGSFRLSSPQPVVAGEVGLTGNSDYRPRYIEDLIRPFRKWSWR